MFTSALGGRTRATLAGWSLSLDLSSIRGQLRLCSRQAPGGPGDIPLRILDLRTSIKLGHHGQEGIVGNPLGSRGRAQDAKSVPLSRRVTLRQKTVVVTLSHANSVAFGSRDRVFGLLAHLPRFHPNGASDRKSTRLNS